MELLAENPTIIALIKEVKKFKSLQQAEILAYVRALRMKREYQVPIAKYRKGTKPLAMEEIDRIKHEVRKHARK